MPFFSKIIWFYHSTCSEEGLTHKMSAFKSLYGGQFTLSTELIKLIFPLMQHQFFLKTYPLYSIFFQTNAWLWLNVKMVTASLVGTVYKLPKHWLALLCWKVVDLWLGPQYCVFGCLAQLLQCAIPWHFTVTVPLSTQECKSTWPIIPIRGSDNSLQGNPKQWSLNLCTVKCKHYFC